MDQAAIDKAVATTKINGGATSDFDPDINIHALARCCCSRGNHFLYPVKGAIKHTETPTPIKILDIKRLKKFSDFENAIVLMRAIIKNNFRF